MWHVSSRSGVATLRTAIHLLLTYLLTYLPSSPIVVMQCHMAQSNILKLLMLPAATLLTLTDDHPPPSYSYTNNAQ